MGWYSGNSLWSSKLWVEVVGRSCVAVWLLKVELLHKTCLNKLPLEWSNHHLVVIPLYLKRVSQPEALCYHKHNICHPHGRWLHEKQLRGKTAGNIFCGAMQIMQLTNGCSAGATNVSGGKQNYYNSKADFFHISRVKQEVGEGSRKRAVGIT